jgi:small subunit ribosomal protein S21
MIELTLAEGDRIDWALKAFKRKVVNSGLLQELRRRRHYTKPSEARQLKSEAAQRRRRSAARRASRRGAGRG